jgi:hypothetical protein
MNKIPYVLKTKIESDEEFSFRNSISNNSSQEVKSQMIFCNFIEPIEEYWGCLSDWCCYSDALSEKSDEALSVKQLIYNSEWTNKIEEINKSILHQTMSARKPKEAIEPSSKSVKSSLKERIKQLLCTRVQEKKELECKYFSMLEGSFKNLRSLIN